MSSAKMKDLYDYLDSLLTHYGYTTKSANADPYADMLLGKWAHDALASLTVRQYPVPQEANYFRQLNVFFRQPPSGSAKVEITFMVQGGQDTETLPGPISGTWAFTHAGDRFQGAIELRQSGSKVTGMWHTSKGKVEPDTSVAGEVNGKIVRLTRFVGNNQNYVLTLSADGNRLDGFGDGWFITHANLNMQRVAALPASAPSAPATSRKGDHLSWPPPRGTYSWIMQTAVTHPDITRPRNIKYASLYYEPATDRTVEEPLSLPAGGTIVGVFPDNCAFLMRDASGKSLAFKDESEARNQILAPGTWALYPRGCGGIDVYVK